jgi:predicted DNA-binding WGR domain protein
MTTREFHFQDGTSSKFWRIWRDGLTCTVQFGRIGSAGQTTAKSYTDDQAAQSAYDKQIAEKVKKGYQEVTNGAGVATAPVTPAAPARPTPAPKQSASPAPPPVVDAAPTAPPVALSRDTTTHLNLDPIDWFWAPWRKTPPLERPPSPLFDLNDALQRLAGISKSEHRYQWDWSRARIPAAPAREEAHFWLVAMSVNNNRNQTSKQLAESLAGQRFDGDLTSTQVFALANATLRSTEGDIAPLIAALCAPDDLLAYLLSEDDANAMTSTQARSLTGAIDGFRRSVLPYLSVAEREQLSARLKPRLDVTQWPTSHYQSGPAAFYLAAMLGGFNDILSALVDSWDNDRYTGDPWPDHYQRPQEIIFGLEDPRQVEAQFRRLRLRLSKPEYMRAWLAHTELGVLDVARDSILMMQNKDDDAAQMTVFTRVVAPEVAPHMLELMRNSRAPQIARDWLESHPAYTVAGLLPVAAGRGALAEAAADLLRRFARRGCAELIAEGISGLPADAAAKLRAGVLDITQNQRPPFDATSTPNWLNEALAAQPYLKLAKLPAWARVDDLPPIIVNDHCLNDTQAEALLRALQRSKLDEPHPLVAVLKQRADQSSRDALVWGLFEQWLVEGAPSKENWALFALGQLGGDAVALKLTPLIRAWPGESQHQRAVNGLECLRAIGTDTALMQINGIAQKVKFKGLKDRAAECMERIAKDRGLSRAELEDRIVPDCDLDARGERVFDFGPRQFRFALGSDMKPMVRDAQGQLKADLPKPNSKDDAERAAQAVDDWKLLKKQVAEVAKVQAVRLEQAMVTGRQWPRADFELLLARHPLMTHLVRTLVWGAYTDQGALKATFRVTEDQTYADSADETFDLTPFAKVGIVHPLRLPENERGAWGELLSDYEIIPPFMQLGRPILRLEAQELQKTDITRFNHLKIPAASLIFGLEKLGWVRDMPADGGGFNGHSKPFYQANITAVVQYEEGAGIGYIVDAPDQNIRYVAFVPGIQTMAWWPQHKDRLPLKEIDPVVISEVLSDMVTVMAKAK